MRNLRGEDEDRLKKRQLRKGNEKPVQKPWRPAPYTTDPTPTQQPCPSASRPAKKCYRCGETGHLAQDHDKKKARWGDRWSARAQYRGYFRNGWWHDRVND